MTTTKACTIEDARRIGMELGIDWATSPFGVGQYLLGLEVELEIPRDQEVPLVAPRVGREARGQERLVAAPQVGPGRDRLPPRVVHDLDAHRRPRRDGSSFCSRIEGSRR